MPKIISLGMAAASFQYSQEEIFKVLHYPKPFWRIFKASEIQHRQFVVPIDRSRHFSFQEQQDTYRLEALALAKRAIIDALDKRPAADIGALIFCTCTGFVPGPTIAHYLARDLHLRSDVSLTNIVSMGCESGGYPGLSRAVDFVRATGKSAVVVSCELSSLTYYPEPENKPDAGNDYELLRANSLFGDFASAAIVGDDDILAHPSVVDSHSYTDTNYIDDLGYTWRNGRLRVLLSRRVPELATEVSTKAVTELLERHKLKPADVTYWVIHAAGIKVLEMIGDTLGLPDEKLQYSKLFLHIHGNCSSATVGGIAKLTMQVEKPKRGEYLAIVTIGPGMSGGCHLLEFK